MKWYAIKKDYIEYLKRWDSKVPNADYGNRMKCFIGVVLEINGFNYFAPLTSYKPKFDSMKNDVDFYKIVNTETNKVYGAIDINNMIPVPEKLYTELAFENLNEFRDFKNIRDKKQYWKLLSKEIELINEDDLSAYAEKLYKIVTKTPHGHLAKRCCNFKLLEEKCSLFKTE
ncbi:type III toxin-antitoxin system ToxN/AbiQ family toxin [Faecalibacillus faecis]|jgi:protein AbiQ|uniref:type III toxin-antitoxin system ToxN/AbiQ family toxin n=1 Tax=Faecalibacillus faecis TaxID=1982628 RepID=UPI002F956C26